MSQAKPVPCRGCGRDRRTCWTMPCLSLEIIKKRGPRAVAKWIRACLPAHLRAGVRVERASGNQGVRSG